MCVRQKMQSHRAVTHTHLHMISFATGLEREYPLAFCKGLAEGISSHFSAKACRLAPHAPLSRDLRKHWSLKGGLFKSTPDQLPLHFLAACLKPATSRELSLRRNVPDRSPNQHPVSGTSQFNPQNENERSIPDSGQA